MGKPTNKFKNITITLHYQTRGVNINSVLNRRNQKNNNKELRNQEKGNKKVRAEINKTEENGVDKLSNRRFLEIKQIILRWY